MRDRNNGCSRGVKSPLRWTSPSFRDAPSASLLIELEATPMLMPCVSCQLKPACPCLPPGCRSLPRTAMRWRRRRRRRKLTCARHRRQATVLSASLRSPRGARHRARRCTGSMPPSSPRSPRHLQQHSQRRRRRRRRGGGGDQGGRGDEDSGPGDHNDDPILEKGNRRIATARSGSAAYALLRPTRAR
jgi:hypothetical protein